MAQSSSAQLWLAELAHEPAEDPPPTSLANSREPSRYRIDDVETLTGADSQVGRSGDDGELVRIRQNKVHQRPSILLSLVLGHSVPLV